MLTFFYRAPKGVCLRKAWPFGVFAVLYKKGMLERWGVQKSRGRIQWGSVSPPLFGAEGEESPDNAWVNTNICLSSFLILPLITKGTEVILSAYTLQDISCIPECTSYTVFFYIFQSLWLKGSLCITIGESEKSMYKVHFLSHWFCKLRV